MRVRLLSLAGLVLLTSACTKDPAPAVLSAASPAERGVTVSVSSASGSADLDPIPPRWSDDHALVGELHRGGTYACRPGQRSDEGEWYGVHPVIGFVPVHAASDLAVPLEELRGRMVVAWGEIAKEVPPADDLPPDARPCEVLLQMRSDWVQTPDGIRIRRTEVRPLPAFRAVRIERYTGFGAAIMIGGPLELMLRNDFGHELTGVRLTTHYEGCFGKPGTISQAGETVTLATGARLSVEVDPTIIGPGRRPGQKKSQYYAHSATVEARSPSVTFDLTAVFEQDRASAECRR